MDKRFLQTMLICFAISFIYLDWIRPPSPLPTDDPAKVGSTASKPAAETLGTPAVDGSLSRAPDPTAVD